MDKSLKNTSETLIGIDYGSANIGVALGKNGLAVPLQVIKAGDMPTALHVITRIAYENKASKFVVGLPVTEDGKETAQSLETRKFAKLLKIHSKKPVVFFNEYESSKEAHAQKEFYGFSSSKKTLSDHIAATIILKRYFNDVS